MIRKINTQYPEAIQQAKANGWLEVARSAVYVTLRKPSAKTSRVYNSRIRITYA